MRVVILLAIIGTAIAAPERQQRIVGGTNTDISQHPFMANFHYGLVGGVVFVQWCGGAILSPTTILSAGDCFYQTTTSVWRVLLGTSFPSNGGTIHYLSTIIVHPDFNENTMDNDIALVRLTSPVSYTSTVQPARIPGTSFVLPDGTELIALGYGRVSSDGTAAEQLQQVSINLFNQEDCVARYAELKTQPGFQNWPDVTDSMMCVGATAGGRDACQGDHGGPVTISGDIVFGIISWGRGCGLPDYPGIKTRVAYHSDWIVANSV